MSILNYNLKNFLFVYYIIINHKTTNKSLRNT